MFKYDEPSEPSLSSRKLELFEARARLGSWGSGLGSARAREKLDQARLGSARLANFFTRLGLGSARQKLDQARLGSAREPERAEPSRACEPSLHISNMEY